jgi:chorismate synthase
MSSIFGNLFKVSTFGESHGKAVGVVIDGCPANIPISLDKTQEMLDRRRPGQNSFVSPRQEKDQIICLSGMEQNKTLGSPICLLVCNRDQNKKEYQKILRPSHADYTTLTKYKIVASSGGGRASARETLARVAAGSVAQQVINFFYPDFSCLSYVESIKNIKIENLEINYLSRQQIKSSPLRCPDPDTSKKMEILIKKMQEEKDSVGGCVKTIIKNCPTGLGEPVFDKISAKLAQAMMSIPASKGFEIGSGFSATLQQGSEHNDLFTLKNDKVTTKTNNSGGIQGGISNGEDISFRVAFKPTATIGKPQETLDQNLKKTTMEQKGRHDPCVVPRAVVVVEAMSYLVIVDLLLQHRAISLPK